MTTARPSSVFPDCRRAVASAVLAAALLCVTAAFAQQPAQPVLTRIAQIRRLTLNQAMHGYPVHLRAVVTYYAAEGPDFQGRDTWVGSGTPDLFIQDDTAGIWVNLPKGAPALAAGDLIDLAGVTEAPDFAPQIGQPRYTIAGRAPLPEPKRVSLERMLSTAEDSQWVETQGIVRQARLKDGQITLDVAVAGGHLKAFLPGRYQLPPTSLVDAEVLIRGACGAIFNKKLQLVGILLYVPGLQQISVIKAAPEDAFAAGSQPIETVARFAPQQEMGHRVRVQGTVTVQDSPKTIYLSDGRSGLRIDLAEAASFKAGERLDVVGFPRISDYTLAVEDSICRRVGIEEPLAPVPVTAAQVLNGDYDSLLVSIAGRLLEKSALTDGLTLVLANGDTVFDVSLHQAEGQVKLDSLRVGSVVRVSGICVANKDENDRSRSFKILLSSAGGIAVLSEPSWWTLPRALGALGVLALAILAVLAWALVLQRQAALRQRYHNLVENANDIIFTLDLKQTVTTLNKAGERILGYSKKDAAGMPLLSLLPADSRQRIGEVITRASLGQLCPIQEWDLAVLHGAPAPVEVSLQTVRQGAKITGLLGIARDISDRKRAEAEMFRAKEAAETANRAKSGFLANMSHELRTPLNAVIGYSEMLQEVAAERGQHDLLPDLCRIQTAGKHLLGLINDILDLSKIEAGKVQLYTEPFAAAAVVHDAVSTVRPLLEKNGNRLEVECSRKLVVLADQTRTRQVLFNLLSNACKFTGHGLIRLEAKRETFGGRDTVAFRVSDTGIGMTPDQVDRLYSPFMQADASTTRKYGGTGLGLAISSRFCHMMGGTLTVESQLGRGSTFTVRLPAEAPAAETVAASPVALLEHVEHYV